MVIPDKSPTIVVSRQSASTVELDAAIKRLDREIGILLECLVDIDGWYRPCRVAALRPLLAVEAISTRLVISCLRKGAEVFTRQLADAAGRATGLKVTERQTSRFELGPLAPAPKFGGNMPGSLFLALKVILRQNQKTPEEWLGLYGTGGDELAWHAGISSALPNGRHLMLFLPGEILVATAGVCQRLTVKIASGGEFQEERRRMPPMRTLLTKGGTPQSFKSVVREAIAAMKKGEVGTIVLSRAFSKPAPGRISDVYESLRVSNPTPYSGIANYGDEQLILNSPLQLVRLRGTSVESAVICGTVRRGASPIDEAANIDELLRSSQDRATHTACSDFSRSDKVAVCEQGSIEVVQRRAVERYAHVMQLVDRICGKLRDDCDALDVLRHHIGPTTVLGAPRSAAYRLIRALESTPRRWYGGAILRLGFDGSLDAGIIIRSIHVRDGMAEVRPGAGLVATSSPEHEEGEIRLKAAALLDALSPGRATALSTRRERVPKLPDVWLVDTGDELAELHRELLWRIGAASSIIKPTELSDVPRSSTVVVVLGGLAADWPSIRKAMDVAVAARIPLCAIGDAAAELAARLGATLERPAHGEYGGQRELVFSRRLALPGLGRVTHAFVGSYEAKAFRFNKHGAISILAKDPEGAPVIFRALRRPYIGLHFRPESVATLPAGLGPALMRAVLCALSSDQKSH